ncbi:MAG: hypothetical protein VW236_07760 [Flavobacteriaceae bacterium]
MAWVSVAVAAVGFVSGAKAAREQRGAARSQNEINLLRNIQARRDFMKDIRTARSNALLNTVASGADISSSAYQGSRASLQSQAAMGEYTMMEERRLGADVAAKQERASRYQTIGQLAQVAGDIYTAIRPTLPKNQQPSGGTTPTAPSAIPSSTQELIRGNQYGLTPFQYPASNINAGPFFQNLGPAWRHYRPPPGRTPL